MSSTFGHLYRVTTFGESHGGAVGAVIDGCPPRIPLTVDDIQVELDRRRPGQSAIVTPRQEEDRAEIVSGVFEGFTLGTPIAVVVRNKDARPEDYAHLKDVYRPSHADFTWQTKYGIRNHQGGGRSSARETIGRVAAGAIARKALGLLCGVEIVAYVKQVQSIEAGIDASRVTREQVEANIVRCPDAAVAAEMIALIERMRDAGDSVGGVVEVVARNVPAGWGDPVFDKLEADLAKAFMSLPASRGFEIGSGFGGVALTGAQHNDAFAPAPDDARGTRTVTNRSGGVQGGISNGEPIVARVAFKPTSTIRKAQDTVNREGEAVTLEARGRHDPCVLPRAVPIVEAMTAIVLFDAFLRQRGQCGGER
ncbi:MAG: chorismate synthase [Proteobacteria bacterium]|nr:chorismate synthase [Pseudomonadota bacterium]